MKRSLSVLLLAGTALMAASAQAAPVFLLQFGSFESREEADAKLSGLKSKHAGVLSRMESGVREVTLPPNNLTVYRTQAGPLATRADAQSVCSQLASNGDECYVVETAMMPSFSAPAAQVAEAAPPAPAPVSAPVPSSVPAPVSAPVPAAEPTPMPVAAAMPAPETQPAVSAPPAMEAAPMPAAAPVPVAMATSGRDPQNVAAMNRVAGGASAAESTMPAPSAAVMAERTEASAIAMHEELAAAADRQAAGIDAETAPMPPKKDPSLWNRLFGDDEDEEETAKRAPAPDAPVQAAPVEPIVMAAAPAPAPAPVMPPPPVIVPAPFAEAPQAPTPPGAAPERSVILPAAAPITAAPAPVMAPPAPVMAPEPTPAPAPVAMAAPVVTQAESFPLPPPPAPLVGKSQPVMPAPAATQPIVTGTMPMPAPAPVMAPPAPVMAPAPVPSFSAAKMGVPNVQVEEAKRVPLTQASVPQAPVMAPPAPMPSAAPASMPASLSPSATLGQKTLWAQVGPFRDQQAALAYWDDYRRAHPDFPVVRVRVTSPMQAHQRGLAHVTLRVGPFAREATIRHLCTTMTAPDLQCGPMTDMGFASGAGKQRGMLPQSRYNR